MATTKLFPIHADVEGALAYIANPELDSESIVGYNMVTMKLEVQDMLAMPELAMPRSRKVTIVCNSRREVWTDCEQAKAYFLELMISIESYPA